jgi:hypothetical protein
MEAPPLPLPPRSRNKSESAGPGMTGALEDKEHDMTDYILSEDSRLRGNDGEQPKSGEAPVRFSSCPLILDMSARLHIMGIEHCLSSRRGNATEGNLNLIAQMRSDYADRVPQRKAIS